MISFLRSTVMIVVALLTTHVFIDRIPNAIALDKIQFAQIGTTPTTPMSPTNAGSFRLAPTNAVEPLIITGVAPAEKVTVSAGSITSEIIIWLIVVLGPILVAFIVGAILKLLSLVNIKLKDGDRARLEAIVENGLALAKQQAAEKLDGRWPVEIRGKLAATAVQYVQSHGADTLKALGFDPNDPKAVEAIQARVAKFLDREETAAPAAPTP